MFGVCCVVFIVLAVLFHLVVSFFLRNINNIQEIMFTQLINKWDVNE